MKLSFLFMVVSSVFVAASEPTAQPSAAQMRKVMTNPQNRQMLVAIARSMEVKAVAQPPKWLPGADARPIMTIAWLSDLHIGAVKGARERSKSAFNLLRDDLKPDMTFLTGDLNAQFAGLPKGDEGRPEAEKRWLWLKSFVEAELSRPYVVIPGDNWPQGFSAVFGSPTKSFDLCGCHFLFTGVDVKAPSKDICSVFKDDTKKWLKDDLAANAGKPSFFIMHETAFPPVFLDAPWLAQMLNGQPNVLAALGGHFHLDLEFPQGRWKQLICPAIGPSRRPAFKLMQFHKKQVVILTYEFADGKFSQVSKFQRIAIPKELRGALSASGMAPVQENIRSMQPRPVEFDGSLARRAPEVEQALMQAATKIGLQHFLAP